MTKRLAFALALGLAGCAAEPESFALVAVDRDGQAWTIDSGLSYADCTGALAQTSQVAALGSPYGAARVYCQPES